MTDDEILDRLTPIFRDVFGHDIVLTMQTEAEGVPNWDSMAQVTLAVEIESTFGVIIRSAEMERLQHMRDLVGMIRARAPAAAIGAR